MPVGSPAPDASSRVRTRARSSCAPTRTSVSPADRRKSSGGGANGTPSRRTAGTATWAAARSSSGRRRPSAGASGRTRKSSLVPAATSAASRRPPRRLRLRVAQPPVRLVAQDPDLRRDDVPRHVEEPQDARDELDRCLELLGDHLVGAEAAQRLDLLDVARPHEDPHGRRARAAERTTRPARLRVGDRHDDAAGARDARRVQALEARRVGQQRVESLPPGRHDALRVDVHDAYGMPGLLEDARDIAPVQARARRR